ncbi:MAG: DUF4954 family protein, partial [Phycisphaeraceae bacterium]
MASNNPYIALTDEQVRALERRGCVAEDWSQVQVAGGLDPARVRDTCFAGEVRLGTLTGSVATDAGLAKPAGIYNATIANCTIGDNVRIANVGVHLANYNIGDGACIENVGAMETRPTSGRGAAFGNGVEINLLNEAGGREVILFNELSSQFAHLICLHRYRPKLIEKLTAMARTAADRARADRGTVGAAVRIASVNQIIDVNIGDHAQVNGAASLVNGTILSSTDAPTTVGADVQAEHFIIAEGSEVTGGAIVSKTYVGQGCLIGKQFSAEGSVFFANCEGLHGEACSVFAGPYTVTHHKSTLLIAALFSFFNAGSGTNQSNHMYKLGPVHEGKLERGTKTGSCCYMVWPCRVGPFSVVLGKHTRAFDSSIFPFSLIDATPAGQCVIVPGLNVAKVGTVRDAAKWPARDRRKGTVKRDRISFDVFSPMTVGRMIDGSARLEQLQQDTDASANTVTVNGAEIKRVLLPKGQRFYRTGIHMYLLEKIVSRIEAAVHDGAKSLRDALAPPPDAVFCWQWVDIGGQLMPRQRLDDLCRQVETGRIADLDAFHAELDTIHAAYADDEWVWVKQAYEQVFGVNLADATADDLTKIAELLLSTRGKFLKLVLSDAAKEFGDVTRTGFGQDGTPQDAEADFVAVRG